MEKGKREAGEDPHHHAKLLGHWLDGGERRRGERLRYGSDGGGGSFGC
jgi:hypothetical protein